jgi:hypothetical protein
MNRSGFALLAVLWVLTALTALTGAGILVARVGSETTRNRILLARAEWAREACGEILLARFAIDPTIRNVGPIDLGHGTWCRASLEDPASKLNFNTADRDALEQLFTAVGVAPALAESIIVRRERGAIYNVRQVPGVDSAIAAQLTPFVTSRGTGVVNVTAAPLQVLRTVPGMTEEAVFLLTTHRALRPIHNADELAGLLSRSSRAVLLSSYAEFVRATVFEPPQLVVTLEGGIRNQPIVARATLTAVPVPGRLAVIRRETE